MAQQPAACVACNVPTCVTASRKGAKPDLLLANKWEDSDATGWWISEKLDGVRAYWDGTHFLSRLGNIFPAPAWFTQALPVRLACCLRHC